jgi:hypothetical protein
VDEQIEQITLTTTATAEPSETQLNDHDQCDIT